MNFSVRVEKRRGPCSFLFRYIFEDDMLCIGSDGSCQLRIFLLPHHRDFCTRIAGGGERSAIILIM